MRSILEGNPFWFEIHRAYFFLDAGNIALWVCQLATVVGAILLMVIGHRSPTARTVATLGIGGMFCLHSAAVPAARPVYSIGLNWLLVLDFVLSLVAVVAIVIGNRSAGLAARPSAVPARTFAPQGMPPHAMPQFGMPQPGMVQGGVPQQGGPQGQMQYQGMPQSGVPQQGIAPETIVQQQGPPGIVPQPGMPQQAMPSAPMPQPGVFRQGMPLGGVPLDNNQPPASNPGYQQPGQQFSAPPVTGPAAQGNPPQF
ncbi:hypothetical protein [Nocardia jiangxiensis]|uniref:Uncharacterized protein n=1 Tax=Nocardia jiangxiensis TaxID=282685 RepID=A0ABW6S7F7_9NOCA|nr:hypothetical protein [Nocardia jiangxiensis]